MSADKLKKCKFLAQLYESKFKLGCISLIPSENTSFIYNKYIDFNLSNRYFFEDDNVFFPGRDELYQIYEIISTRLKEILKVKYINLSPISGLSQMQSVILSLSHPSYYIMGLPVERGGHYLLKKNVELLGRKFIPLPFKTNFDIDYEKLLYFLKKFPIDLIYIDQMTSSFDLDFDIKFVKSTYENVVFYKDVSHNLAFLLGNLWKNPLFQGYDAFGGSFHKSFPGSHKAFIATNKKDINDRVKKITDIYFSNNHFRDLLNIGLVLENMEDKWSQYVVEIVKTGNLFARILSKALNNIVFFIKKGNLYTLNHQLLIGIKYKNLAYKWQKKLEEKNVLVNIMSLPFGLEYGFRLGFQEYVLLKLYNCLPDEKIDIKDLVKRFILAYKEVVGN